MLGLVQNEKPSRLINKQNFSTAASNRNGERGSVGKARGDRRAHGGGAGWVNRRGVIMRVPRSTWKARFFMRVSKHLLFSELLFMYRSCGGKQAKGRFGHRTNRASGETGDQDEEEGNP